MRSTLDSASTPGSSQTPLTQSTPPAAQETPPKVCPVSGEPLAATTFQKKLPMCSWPLGGQARRNSTKPDRAYLNKWMAFCGERKIAYYSPPLNEALQFLVRLFNRGLSYSALNTARSALSAIIIINNNLLHLI